MALALCTWHKRQCRRVHTVVGASQVGSLTLGIPATDTECTLGKVGRASDVSTSPSPCGCWTGALGIWHFVLGIIDSVAECTLGEATVIPSSTANLTSSQVNCVGLGTGILPLAPELGMIASHCHRMHSGTQAREVCSSQLARCLVGIQRRWIGHRQVAPECIFIAIVKLRDMETT